MNNPETGGGTYTLWGGPLSLYSGKARAYLIKKGIPYRELFPSHPNFSGRILPSVGLFVIPVLEAPDGTVVQDTTDIFDYVEARYPEPCVAPKSPLQNAVAWLLSAYGSEGLLASAMHYRWSYRKEQERFLIAEFGRIIAGKPGDPAKTAMTLGVMQQMNSYLPVLGVTPETIPAIEASTEALMDLLDVHLGEHPYLLGGRPSIADFGMMASLFAHLGRDPVPSGRMKLRAPNLFRWTERMNLPRIGDGEFWNHPETFPPGDELPPTLVPVVAHVFRDWGPELIAAAGCYNAWIASRPDMPSGQLVSGSQERRVHPALGEIVFELQGRQVRRQCPPQALWHFSRAQSLFRSLEGETARLGRELLAATGGEQVVGLKLARDMVRRANVLTLA